MYTRKMVAVTATAHPTRAKGIMTEGAVALDAAKGPFVAQVRPEKPSGQAQ